MGEYADEAIALGLAQMDRILANGGKIINPFWDTWLWKDSNEVVRHFESMDSFHLCKIREFLEKQQSSKNRLQRKQRIGNINSVLKRRGYVDDLYEFEKVGVETGLRCDPYDNEIIIESGEFTLGSGIENWHKWWEYHNYILEQPVTLNYY